MIALLVSVSFYSFCHGFLIDPSVHGSAQFFWDFGRLDSDAQNVVAKLRDTHICTSIYEACYNFTASIHDRDVSYKAVHVLSDIFRSNYPSVPADCTCRGETNFWSRVELDDHKNCYQGDSNYKKIYDHFFGHGRNNKLGCNTHQSPAYSKQGSNCQCSVATKATSPAPVTTSRATSTVKPATSTIKPTTSTVKPTMTTVANYPTQACDKFKVIEDVGRGTPVNSSGPSSCSDSLHFSSDVLVTDSCYIGQVSTWKKGNNVMERCKSGSLQPYTAIATFPPGSDTFQISGYIAAVLVKCELSGIEIAFQDCGQAPILKHLTEGGFGQLDPNNYYTIVTQ